MKPQKTTTPSNKSFGLFFAAVFAAGSSYGFVYKLSLGATLLLSIFSAGFFILAITKPSLLAPLNKLWMKLGFVMGSFVSPIVIAIIYLCIFLPLGLSMRLFGRDELKLKRTSASISFWIERDIKDATDFSFNRQF